MNIDLLNALFEFGAAIVMWINVLKLYKDKQIHGVFWVVWIFYACWGIWNLYYYPMLNQTLSFYCGIILVIGNIVWVSLAFYYKIILKNKLL